MPPVRSLFPRELALNIADVVFPPPHPYLHDPVGWVTGGRMNDHPTRVGRRILESVAKHRYTAVQACHGIGKTFTAAEVVAWWLDVHPPGEAFVVTTAPTGEQVKSVLWREIGKAHTRGELSGRITMDAHWYFRIAGRDELVGFGRKPADHDPAAFSGIHARYVLVIIDEACGVPQQLYDAVDSLATNQHARVLAIGNPDDPQSFFAKVCGSGKERWDHVIEVNAFDSPNFTEEELSKTRLVTDPVTGRTVEEFVYAELRQYMERHGYQPSTESVPARLREMLVTPEWVAERLRRWGPGSPVFQAKVLGQFPDLSDRSVFTKSMLRKCYETDLPGMDAGVRAFDIAEEGGDRSIGYWNRGGVVRWLYAGPKQELPETAADLYGIMAPYPDVPAWIDANGIGVHTFYALRDKGMPVLKFIGSHAAFEPEYANRRAEAYFHMKRMAETGELDLDATDEGHADDLENDLLAIRWKVDGGGRLLLESKEDMAKRGVKSTDHGDAASMSCQSPAGHLQAAADLNRTRGQRRKSEGFTGDLLNRAM